MVLVKCVYGLCQLILVVSECLVTSWRSVESFFVVLFWLRNVEMVFGGLIVEYGGKMVGFFDV